MPDDIIRNGDFEDEGYWDTTAYIQEGTGISSSTYHTGSQGLLINPTAFECVQMEQSFSSLLCGRGPLKFWYRGNRQARETGAELYLCIRYREAYPDLLDVPPDEFSFPIEQENKWYLATVTDKEVTVDDGEPLRNADGEIISGYQRFKVLESIGFGYQGTYHMYGGPTIYVDQVEMEGESFEDLWREFEAVFMTHACRFLTEAMARRFLRRSRAMKSSDRRAPRKAAAASTPGPGPIQDVESRLARIEGMVEQILKRGRAEVEEPSHVGR